MQRVLVDVVPTAAGWTVRVMHVVDPDADPVEGTILHEPYPMAAIDLPVDIGGGVVSSIRVPAPDGEIGAEPLAGLLVRQLTGTLGGVANPNDGRQYGAWLHRALLGPAWADVQAFAGPGGRIELALRFPADSDYDLHRLVWEGMYAPPPAGGAVGALTQPIAKFLPPRPYAAVTRLISQEAPSAASYPLERVPRVLFAMGARFNDPKVRPGAMFLGLLRSLEADGTCVSRVALGLSLKQLQAECARYQPDVVHLVAHGRAEGGSGEVKLLFDEDWVSHEQIRSALGQPVAVFLSACDTGRAGPGQGPFAAHLVRSGIPIVAAMAGRIGVSACRLFTRRLVEAAAAGTGLVEASAAGRSAALIGVEDPDSDLDWALPTLFLADAVRPTVNVVDRAVTDRAAKVTRNLLIARKPIFVGRTDVLGTIDQFFDADQPIQQRLGMLAVVSKEPIDNLGSKRLLREAACRLVRAGHVPVLVGPFDDASTPNRFAEVLAALAATITVTYRAFGVSDPPWSTVLGPPPPEVTEGAREAAVKDVAAGPDPHPLDAKKLVSDDISALVATVKLHGKPFGDHSRAVVLADRVHRWGAGLDPLLDMVTAEGLGTDEDTRTPLVVTAWEGDAGMRLKERESDIKAGWGDYIRLTAFSEDEAIPAYNWTLLHPWQPDGGTQPFNAYVAKNDEEAVLFDDALRDYFRDRHYPVVLENELYQCVKMLLAYTKGNGPLVPIDLADDTALAEWEKLQ
jgi:hypothetical protein